jgi:NAD(P)H-flavin reductase
MAGQFFMLKPKRSGVFLGRPISVAGWKPVKNTIFKGDFDRRTSSDRRQDRSKLRRAYLQEDDDRRKISGGILNFLITRRGQGSRELTEIRMGEDVELIGPLGNYWYPDLIPTDYSKGKASGALALVGGGVGIAPLLALAPELKKRPFDFYAGFKTESFGLDNIKPRAFIISTEDGSQGVKGRILDFFSATGYAGVFACGPGPMLKALADMCIACGVPCFISVEKRMACGVGACLGCKIKNINGTSMRCCTDGPIFNSEELCFED